jgi:nitronate monooxygenase
MAFQLTDLRLRLIQAPMAGGPTTPALAAAVGRAGGLGFLAAGYVAPGALREQIGELRSLLSGGGDGGGAGAFGVNVFVPQPVAQPEQVKAYRETLLSEAAAAGVELPEPDFDDTDHWESKLELLLADPVPVVSFTFGLPSPDVLASFRRQGTYTIGTVTSADEARQAVAAGVDALCVQGPEAGGHRGVFDPSVTPSATPLTALLQEVRAAVSAVPLIAAGGISTAAGVAVLLANGVADVVQVGTAFLRADEAGTNQLYRDALVDDAHTETTVTRAFSGRFARALRTSFIDRHAEDAPAAYPAVNQVTKPLRAAAAARGDANGMSLYAGTGHRHAKAAPAADIITSLMENTANP